MEEPLHYHLGGMVPQARDMLRRMGGQESFHAVNPRISTPFGSYDLGICYLEEEDLDLADFSFYC